MDSTRPAAREAVGRASREQMTMQIPPAGPEGLTQHTDRQADSAQAAEYRAQWSLKAGEVQDPAQIPCSRP